MSGIAYSEERTRLINYPSTEMLNETFYIYKDEADSSMQCGEISSYKGKKIGIVKNDQRMALALTSWKEDYGADLEIVTFDDFSECASAFNEKKIDGFVSADNVVSSYSGITPVEKIGKQPYYLCTARNRVDLLNELNMAISIVNEQDAMVIDELKSKYYTETTVSVFLSERERDWMESHDKIVVGYLDDYLPYCGTDKGGNATGLVSDIMPDFFKALPGECEIEIVYQSFSDQQEMLDCLKSGEIDLAMPVSDGSWYSEQEGFLQSSSIVAFPIALAYREPYSDDITQKIAVNKNNLRQYWYTSLLWTDTLQHGQ